MICNDITLFFCEAQSEQNVIFFKSLSELSSINNTKQEAAEASIRAQDNPTNADKVIWKQRITFSQNTYEPKGLYGMENDWLIASAL